MLLNRFKRYMDEIMPTANPMNKDCLTACILNGMYRRCQSIFEWKNLPDTVPQRMLELYTQKMGTSLFAPHNDSFYIFFGGFGGEPDAYYIPQEYIVSNPYLNFSKSYKIGTDSVLIPNDSLYSGLDIIHRRYAMQLADVEISLNMASINSRIPALISAPDDRTYESAVAYLEKIRAGEIGIIAENSFFDGIRTSEYAGNAYSNTIGKLIEQRQYLWASWLNEIGLNANYNMKRESLNSAESALNSSALHPLVDDMLNMRKIACEQINKLFGLDIYVEYNSSWEMEEIAMDKQADVYEVEVNSDETEEIE